MANAMLDARQEDGGYRRVELITRAASAAPVDGRGEGADCRREFRRRREHIRGRAATRSGARAADGVAAPGVEGG